MFDSAKAVEMATKKEEQRKAAQIKKDAAAPCLPS